jgi:hypothetical protein
MMRRDTLVSVFIKRVNLQACLGAIRSHFLDPVYGHGLFLQLCSEEKFERCQIEGNGQKLCFEQCIKIAAAVQIRSVIEAASTAICTTDN